MHDHPAGHKPEPQTSQAGSFLSHLLDNQLSQKHAWEEGGSSEGRSGRWQCASKYPPSAAHTAQSGGWGASHRSHLREVMAQLLQQCHHGETEFEFPASGFNLAQPLMSQGFEVNQKTEDLFLCLSLQQIEGKYTTNKNFKINKVNMRDRHLSEQYVQGKRDGRWGLRGFRCLSPTWQAWIQGVDCHP